jgi:hypothetical protein
LARAEAMVLLNNGHGNSIEAAREEFLIWIGLQVREKIVKLFKEKAIEERISVIFRAICGKIMMQNIEALTWNTSQCPIIEK